jgi:uncharacterized protein YfaQ (DUF2300 family)
MPQVLEERPPTSLNLDQEPAASIGGQAWWWRQSPAIFIKIMGRLVETLFIYHKITLTDTIR